MNIQNSNFFNWTTPINRYSNIPMLFPQNQDKSSNAGIQFPTGIRYPSNNYSYFTSSKVADDFTKLNQKAHALTLNQSGNIFEKTGATATSSNANAVAAKAANGAQQGTYELQVTQIAKAQENAGAWSDAKAATLAVDGKQTMTIKVADQNGVIRKNADINVQTIAGQTNQEVLDQTAALINKKSQDLGVQARVESRTVNGVEQSRLVVAGVKTGVNSNSFTINDTTGKLATDAGVNNVTTVAQNAKYSLNGLTHESQSNDIAIDRRGQVTATLKNATKPGETVKIGVRPQDVNTMYNNVKDFVGQYNQTMKDLNNSGNSPVANPNVSLTQINSADRNKLYSIGITVNDDHTLSFNESRFRTALNYEPDKVRDILGGSNGLGVKVSEKAANVDLANNYSQNSDLNQLNSYYPGRFFNYFL